jgi:large subunit ribosomal protein L15
MRPPKRGFTMHGASRSPRSTSARSSSQRVTDAKKTIDAEAMKAAGLLRRAKDGVRLLAAGEIKTKLTWSCTELPRPPSRRLSGRQGQVETGRRRKDGRFMFVG